MSDHPWGSKYRVGILIGSRTPPDKEDKLRAFRKDLGNGKTLVVVGSSEQEAAEITGMKLEDVASNRKKHGHWDPRMQDGQVDWNKQNTVELSREPKETRT